MNRSACAVLLPAVAVLLAAATLPAAVGPARAADPCPEDTLSCGCLTGGAVVISTAPAQHCGGAWRAGDPCDGACYDLRVGLLQAVAYRNLSCANAADAYDDYVLADVPAGSPILFVAQLRVAGTLSGSATGSVVMAEGPSNGVTAGYSSADSPLDRALAIPLLYAVGEPFRLHLRLRAQLGATPGMADLTATLEFTDLPEGAAVRSCQGYTMPVPAVPSTWARVKAIYR
jgi:hypothetical protein